MKKTDTQLESLMVTYCQLQNISVQETGEAFVSISTYGIPSVYVPTNCDMKQYDKGNISVRKTVAEKLALAQQTLKKQYPDYTLVITYGYRLQEIQIRRFVTILNSLQTFFPNPIDLYEEAHRFVAVPTVAGHPTGGAIDVVIQKNGETLPFGSIQYEYQTKKCYVFSLDITQQEKQYRLLLRKTMMSVGFAPFDGEWWHFSYGDREWAYYYKKPFALYNQILSKDTYKFML